MPKTRILIVCQHFWPESFRINDIADFFVKEKSCDVDVLCGLPNYPTGRFPKGYGYFKNRTQKYKGINIRRALEIPRGSNSNVRIFLNYISFPITSLFHVPRLLLKKYDKIFIYQLSPVMMSIAGILVGKIRRTEITMYVLDLWPENLYSVLDIKNRILRKMLTSLSYWHYRHVDKIIALSESMKHHLIHKVGVPENRVTVIPQAAEKIYEKNIYDKTLARRFRNGFTILYAGNISPAQSFGTIIQAAKRLRSEGLKDINWVIVGDGMSRKEVEQAVKNEGLTDIFYFEGHKPVEAMPRYNYHADLLIGCLVKSKLLEATIPAKVMSYIAAGRPIVLAMDGEVRNLINSTIRCGFAGPTCDPVQLSENIKKLYSLSSNQRKEFGENAKSYHFQNFERNILLNKMFSFILEKRE